MAEGDWLIADRQTEGRGRQGRIWSSPTGNLYASGLVTLRPDDPPAPTLALVAGVALHDAVAIPSALLKWPNDLLIGHAKLAGVLLERVADAAVAGFGVNVLHAPTLAGRVTAALGDGRVTNDLVAPLCEAMAAWVTIWREQGLAAIRDAWSARAHPVGTSLAIRVGDGTTMQGKFSGLTDGCALKLRLADGSVHVIHTGDVFLI